MHQFMRKLICQEHAYSVVHTAENICAQCNAICLVKILDTCSTMRSTEISKSIGGIICIISEIIIKNT
jgi:hypothetical protein